MLKNAADFLTEISTIHRLSDMGEELTTAVKDR